MNTNYVQAATDVAAALLNHSFIDRVGLVGGLAKHMQDPEKNKLNEWGQSDIDLVVFVPWHLADDALDLFLPQEDDYGMTLYPHEFIFNIGPNGWLRDIFRFSDTVYDLIDQHGIPIDLVIVTMDEGNADLLVPFYNEFMTLQPDPNFLENVTSDYHAFDPDKSRFEITAAPWLELLQTNSVSLFGKQKPAKEDEDDIAWGTECNENDDKTVDWDLRGPVTEGQQVFVDNQVMSPVELHRGQIVHIHSQGWKFEVVVLDVMQYALIFVNTSAMGPPPIGPPTANYDHHHELHLTEIKEGYWRAHRYISKTTSPMWSEEQIKQFLNNRGILDAEPYR